MEQAASVVDYSPASAILVFADGSADRAAAEAAVSALGARLLASLPVAEAATRIERQLALDGVLIDLGVDAAEDVDGLLDDIAQRVAEGRFGAVVTVPAAMIDLAAALLDHPEVVLLCDPHPTERIAALGEILARRQPRFHDISAERDMTRLRQLSEEVGRIARTLAVLSAVDQEGVGTGLKDRRNGYGAPAPTPPDSAMIRRLIRLRRLRDQYFDAALFADPAWDMLLDLMAARIEERQVAVSSLCIAAAVPPTTALRWIKALTEQGILVRIDDPADRRRVFISLSDAAAETMTAYLAAARKGDLLG